jgi:hypothetical protein
MFRLVRDFGGYHFTSAYAALACCISFFGPAIRNEEASKKRGIAASRREVKSNVALVEVKQEVPP